VATALTVAAFAIGAVTELGSHFHRPDYDAAAAFIDARARPADPVLDGVRLSPDGIPTELQITLDRPHRVVLLARPRVAYDPFRILSLPPPVPTVVARAAAPPSTRLFLVVVAGSPIERQAVAGLPPGYRRVAERNWPGVDPLRVVVFARRGQTATGA
jgi:hypothetical protein